MLRDLTVQNYRCFEDFHIDSLAKVNLFVGNNSSGKTSLLEAIYLLVNFDRGKAFFEIVENQLDYLHFKNYYYDLDTLFFQHQRNELIYINSQELETGILITLKNRSNLFCIEANQIPENNNYWQWNSIAKYKEFKLPIINTKYLEIDIKPGATSYNSLLINERFGQPANLFIATGKINFNKISYMWDNINLTEKENKIIEALQIIDSHISGIGFLTNINTEPIRIKKDNYSYPMPLSSMGDGIYRIFNIAMSLVTAENGILLVDEIATGLHYEAQTDMWHLILKMAQELNVQVFATTHSWDCIAAFQEALKQLEDRSIGKLFRLDSKYGKHRAVEYDAEDLEIAVRQSIEVR